MWSEQQPALKKSWERPVGFVCTVHLGVKRKPRKFWTAADVCWWGLMKLIIRSFSFDSHFFLKESYLGTPVSVWNVGPPFFSGQQPPIRLLQSPTLLFPPGNQKGATLWWQTGDICLRNILDLIKMLSIPLVARVLLTVLSGLKSQETEIILFYMRHLGMKHVHMFPVPGSSFLWRNIFLAPRGPEPDSPLKHLCSGSPPRIACR